MKKDGVMAKVIGLNSGSSFDGLDVVLAEVDISDEGKLTKPKFIDGDSVQWPEEVAKDVLLAINNNFSVFDLTRLNYEIGAVFAEAAAAMMEKHGLSGEDVAVIGYDGQSIYQQSTDPEKMSKLPTDARLYQKWREGGYGYGLYLGEPAVVATHTNTKVVTRFRPIDHGLAGTGAPLIQYIDYVLLQDELPSLTLNIGGIANIHYVRDREHMRGFDTGPGNVMIDQAMRRYFGREFDKDGAIAASASVNEEMMQELLSHPYLPKPAPKNLWRSDFGLVWADEVFDKYDAKGVAPEDIVATATQYTAECVGVALKLIPEVGEVSELIASGGGTLNKTLMAAIEKLLPAGLSLSVLDDHGFPNMYKEALEGAIHAFSTINGIAANSPMAEGASAFAMLGEITEPPRLAKWS
jgi:anhydro-N-acetylmuramic acid kinase